MDIKRTFKNTAVSHLICFFRNSSAQTLAAATMQRRQDQRYSYTEIQLQPTKMSNHDGLICFLIHEKEKMELSFGFLLCVEISFFVFVFFFQFWSFVSSLMESC